MQKEIQLTDKTLLVVGLPKDASEIEFSDGCLKYYWQKYLDTGETNTWQTLGQFDWQLIGVYPELTEEMAKMVVESLLSFDSVIYADYTKNDYQPYYSLKTSIESFQSLIERERLYLVNPYDDGRGNDLSDFNYFERKKGIFKGELLTVQEWVDKWQEAQQRTFDKWAILIKK